MVSVVSAANLQRYCLGQILCATHAVHFHVQYPALPVEGEQTEVQLPYQGSASVSIRFRPAMIVHMCKTARGDLPESETGR